MKMATSERGPGTRFGFNRARWGSFTLAVAVTGAALAGVAGCTGSGATHPAPTAASSAVEPDPSAVVASLGAVPVPPSSAPEPTPSASAGHPALSAVGGPIAMSLGQEGKALVTVLGPTQATDGQSDGPASRTRAYLRLRVAQTQGSATIASSELTSRDETGRSIALKTDGPRTITTHSGKTSTLTVVGTFESGAAQVTWRHHGRVLAVWTFNVELD